MTNITTNCQSCIDARQELIDLVNKQAEDEGLWMRSLSIEEAYLQQELRKLHKAVEDYAKGIE